jgi:hypothetical protein
MGSSTRNENTLPNCFTLTFGVRTLSLRFAPVRGGLDVSGSGAHRSRAGTSISHAVRLRARMFPSIPCATTRQWTCVPQRW